MSDMPAHLADRAAALRHAFDQSFAESVRIDTTPTEDLLAIHVGPEACALRLSEIAGLFAGKKITRVPGRTAALLGIAGFRGAIVPVYDLPALLGHPMAGTPRWLVVASAAPVALAFAALDGHLRVSRDAIVPCDAGERAPRHVGDAVRMQDGVRSIVRLSSVLDAIARQGSEAGPREEQ